MLKDTVSIEVQGTQRKLSKNIVLELSTLFLNWEHCSRIENIRS